MIQMSQVASLFTLFTHHAKTFRDLVFSLRNSLLKTGMFQHEHIAEEQVVSVINFDVHMKKMLRDEDISNVLRNVFLVRIKVIAWKRGQVLHFVMLWNTEMECMLQQLQSPLEAWWICETR